MGKSNRHTKPPSAPHNANPRSSWRTFFWHTQDAAIALIFQLIPRQPYGFNSLFTWAKDLGQGFACCKAGGSWRMAACA